MDQVSGPTLEIGRQGARSEQSEDKGVGADKYQSR
jgi:hypothetical protein